MSASASTDCYLCGARNDPEADFCVRCQGQLLKLPSEPVDLAETDPTTFIDDVVPDVEEDIVQTPRKQRNRSGSVEDQRLSDALGLSEHDDDVDPDFIDTVVTSVPRATQSASIPLIGTRTGVVPQAAMHAKEFGIRTYVLLAIMLLATAWLGWATVRGDDPTPTPDNLAFTNSTTVPPTTTTTTEAPRRQWSEAETLGHYGPAFTRVQLYSCPSQTPEGARTKIQPLDDMWTAGVAVDDHNVLINSSDLRAANVAIVRARNGTQRLAIVHAGRLGTRIATTLSPISRTLDLDDSAEGNPMFYLTYDHESNVVESHAESPGSALEATVSDVGDLLEVRIGSTRFDNADLHEINSLVQMVEDEDAPNPETICDSANQLELLDTAPTADQTETN